MPPVVAAFGTAISTIGGLTIGKLAVGKFILQAGASLLLSAASRAFSPSNGGQVELQGRNVSVRQPVAPRDMVYGTVRKGGVIVYWSQYGPKKEYAHLVIVLAGHSVNSIGAVYFDGVEAINAGGTVLGRWVGFVDLFEKTNGTQTSNPFPSLSAQVSDWGPNHVLQGCAAIAIRLNLDQNAFPNGVPAISFDIQGKNDILDPRTGVRGFTNNPALCVADFMSMPEKLGGMDAVIGADGGIDSATLIESANICDEIVGEITLGLIGLVTVDLPRYTADGVVTLEGSGRRAIIQALLTSMAGSAVYRGSKWYILAGAYRAPDISIGPNDFDEKSFDLQTRRPMRDNFSAVGGQFISPANDWQPDDFPVYKSAVYIAEDNGVERWLDISLPFTKSAAMAQRLAKIALEKNRRQMSVSFSGKLPLFKATAGDTVSFNFPAFGIENKPFDVESVSFSGDGESGARLELVLRETSPLVYSWEATEAQIYAAAPRTNLPSAFDIDPPYNLQVSEIIRRASSGQGVRTLVTFSWSAPPSRDVSEYEVQFRQVDADSWRSGGLVSERFAQLDDFLEGQFDFRVRARTSLGVVSEYATTRSTILGLSAAPLQLTNFQIYALSGIALLQWDKTIDLDVEIGGNIIIRHTSSPAPSWGNADDLRRVSGGDNGAPVELMQGTYLIRAIDSMGIMGPISAVSTDAVTALEFSPLGFLQEDDEFSGDKSGVAEYGGALILTGGDDIWAYDDIWAVTDLWTGGTVVSGGIYDFDSVLDLSVVKSVKVRKKVEYEGLVLDSDIWAIPDLWAVDDIWGTDPNTSVLVEIATTNDDPASIPTWSSWFPLTVTEVRARGIKARATLQTTNPRATPRVTALRVYTEEVAI